MNEVIETLLDYAFQQNLIEDFDRIYCRNRILSLLKEENYEMTTERVSYKYVNDLLAPLCDIAVQKGIIEDTLRNRDAFDSEIMNCFIQRPSDLISKFELLRNQDSKASTDFFYHLSVSSNYIRKDRIDKNVSYKANTKYGMMEITINLSKPEKDPRDIAKAGQSVSTSYPSCVLCKECEGYHGNSKCDGRSNHRVLPLSLNGEKWFFQYSPYVYYNEHCIVLRNDHVPMKTSKETFARLTEFVSLFPHYFLGSNADLPIVGGSILSHDHFQGGNYDFAMANAEVYSEFDLNGIKAQRLYWALSVLRLKGKDRNSLVECAGHILDVWRNYSDESVDLYAHTGETMHNTITSIARMRNNEYELDLVFRNNRTSDEHPMGIFHPHQEVHHIKKENIGLIEVMGLAVLPARLKDEMNGMKDYLLNGSCDQSIESHKVWLNELKDKYDWTNENVDDILKKEIADVFVQGLEHCGIYTFDSAGDIAFKNLINTIEGTIK